MKDMLDIDYINSLPQPFVARLCGGSEWPVHDIEVSIGLVRIDVVGKLEVQPIGNVICFIDSEGREHASDSFFPEDEF